MEGKTDEVVKALERIEKRLGSLERWLRFENMEKLKMILENELNDERKKLSFEYSDGSRGYREVGQMAGVPGATIQYWWGRWFAMGIVELSPKRIGRVQRICSLTDMGIDNPIDAKKSRSKNRSSSVQEDNNKQNGIGEENNGE